jgi:hypothetical protein
MNDARVDPNRELDADIAALRASLGAVRAPADGEDALRAAVRARREALSAAARDSTAAPVAARRRSAVRLAPLAFAAAVALAGFAALLTLRAERGIAPRAPPAASPAAPAAAARPPASAFHPLAFSPALSPTQSYAVVRVRIPLTALAPGHAAAPDASIDADVLVGDDGLPAAIRFDSADTLYVSTVSN